MLHRQRKRQETLAVRMVTSVSTAGRTAAHTRPFQYVRCFSCSAMHIRAAGPSEAAVQRAVHALCSFTKPSFVICISC